MFKYPKVLVSKDTKKYLKDSVTRLKNAKNWDDWKNIVDEITYELTLLGYTWEERRSLMRWGGVHYNQKLYFTVEKKWS